MAQMMPRHGKKVPSPSQDVETRDTKLVLEEAERQRHRALRSRTLARNARTVRPHEGYLIQRRSGMNDRKVWVTLEPEIATLTLWDSPPGHMLMEFPRKSRVWKLWRLSEVVCDSTTKQISLHFVDPKKAIHLQAIKWDYFVEWKEVLVPYAGAHGSGSSSDDMKDTDSGDSDTIQLVSWLSRV